MSTSPIGHYPNPAPPVECVPLDPRTPEVARRVTALIVERQPELTVEHVGSTAVPECAGKGVVDLMLLYPEGELEAAKATLDDLGFQRQFTGKMWPESRPMRIGTIEHEGEIFRLHVHVLAHDSPEVATLRRFRDRLRTEPALVTAYVEEKQELIAAGLTEPRKYSAAKSPFVEAVLAEER
jgi:GrpB-like predicted nucleotidyltransferase (UPF0157 family)